MYYKLLDFKNILIAKRDCLNASEIYRKITNLKANIDYKITKNNILEKDINEIRRTQKTLNETKKMIIERIKKCKNHISKKNKGFKHLYFLNDTQYLLRNLDFINKELKKLTLEINNLPTSIVNKAISYIENNSKQLKKRIF